MSYQVAHHDCGEILKISITGQATNANASIIADEVGQIVIGQPLKRILVDVRELHGRIGLADTVFLVG